MNTTVLLMTKQKRIHIASATANSRTWFIVKQVPSIACHQKQISEHFCPLHLGSIVAKESTTQPSIEWNNARRGRARSALVVSIGSPVAGRSHPYSQHKTVGLHVALLCCNRRTSCLPQTGDRHSSGIGQVSYDAHT